MDETIVWQPKDATNNNLYRFMRFIEQSRQIKLPDYQALHQWSIKHPALFWESLATFFHVSFHTPAREILSYAHHSAAMIDAQWFQGATLNFTATLLKRNDSHPALIIINELGKRKVIRFNELRQQVAACAASMQALGVQPLDRVAGVLCNNEYPIIAMLASASLGAIWCSCSPDFGAAAIVDRLSQIEPKLLFVTAQYTYQGKTYHMQEKIDYIKQEVKTLQHVILCNTSENHTAMCWDNFLSQENTLTSEPFAFNHPLYILFSSGTTGKPKCIIHSCGGTLLQHLKELGLHTNLTQDDTLLFYTTCGWMMWNWMVSALALGATLVLYDGAPTYPNPQRLFEVIKEEKVTVFGTSAKYLASIERAHVSLQENPPHDLQTILSTGSPLLPTQYDYVRTHISPTVQLSSISGGTDIIGCFALGNPMTPVYRGELQCIGLGFALDILNDEGQSLRGEVGELVCTQPFPSMPVGFYNDPNQEKYRKAYFERFPGIWTHGDFAEITPHHGLIIHGRSDATLNPGGVRIGTAEIYRQLEKIPEIQDSVVIGQDWKDDTRIILFVTLSPGYVLDEALKTQICQTLRYNASPRHVPAKIIAVPDIPRTINGKTVEMAVRQIIHGHEVLQLDSLANPDALQYFKNREELAVD